MEITVKGLKAALTKVAKFTDKVENSALEWITYKNLIQLKLREIDNKFFLEITGSNGNRYLRLFIPVTCKNPDPLSLANQYYWAYLIPRDVEVPSGELTLVLPTSEKPTKFLRPTQEISYTSSGPNNKITSGGSIPTYSWTYPELTINWFDYYDREITIPEEAFNQPNLPKTYAFVPEINTHYEASGLKKILEVSKGEGISAFWRKEQKGKVSTHDSPKNAILMYKTDTVYCLLCCSVPPDPTAKLSRRNIQKTITHEG